MLNVRTSGNPTSHSLPLTRFYQPHLGPCQCSRRARARSALPWLQRPRLPQFKGHFSALQSITSALGSPPLGWPVHLRLSLLACSQSGGGAALRGSSHPTGSGRRNYLEGAKWQPLAAPPTRDRALPRAIRKQLWGAFSAPPFWTATGLTFSSGAFSTTPLTTKNIWIAIFFLHSHPPRVLLGLKWNQYSRCNKALQLR